MVAPGTRQLPDLRDLHGRRLYTFPLSRYPKRTKRLAIYSLTDFLECANDLNVPRPISKLRGLNTNPRSDTDFPGLHHLKHL